MARVFAYIVAASACGKPGVFYPGYFPPDAGPGSGGGASVCQPGDGNLVVAIEPPYGPAWTSIPVLDERGNARTNYRAAGTVSGLSDTGFTVDAGGATLDVRLDLDGVAFAEPDIGAEAELISCPTTDDCGESFHLIRINGATWLLDQWPLRYAGASCDDPAVQLFSVAVDDCPVRRVGDRELFAGHVSFTSAEERIVVQSRRAVTSARTGRIYAAGEIVFRPCFDVEAAVVLPR